MYNKVKFVTQASKFEDHIILLKMLVLKQLCDLQDLSLVLVLEEYSDYLSQ
jgi:hypothetical protein